LFLQSPSKMMLTAQNELAPPSQPSTFDPSQLGSREEELAEKGAIFRDFLTSRVRPIELSSFD
jgi:hypothetical protein